MRFRDQPSLTVGALNRAVRLGLEQAWGDVTVMGEIGDLTRAASGHIYFTLNDEREAAQIRGVMFRSDARRARATLEVGARVCMRGGLTLYEPRGTFQLLARAAYPQGEGDLAAQFRRLVEKLSAEGLTDPARKRALPLLPRCIGLVTSEHGAAVHDVLRVAHGRCPVRIVVAPCVVQGQEAPLSVVRALSRIQRVPEVDVVIVARGGGSADDLWAFNDERVARAIAACRVPVVSGVGHEVDTTIADLVADARAATPSNAAELVVPLRSALEDKLAGCLRALSRALETRLGREHLRLSRLSRRLLDPRTRFGAARAALHALDSDLLRIMRARLAAAQLALEQQGRRLLPLSPMRRLGAQRVALTKWQARLERSRDTWLLPRATQRAQLHERAAQAMRGRLLRDRHRLGEAVIRLEGLSPLRVLARGYAIAFQENTGRALRRAKDARPGELLRIKLHEGDVRARVVSE